MLYNVNAIGNNVYDSIKTGIWTHFVLIEVKLSEYLNILDEVYEWFLAI